MKKATMKALCDAGRALGGVTLTLGMAFPMLAVGSGVLAPASPVMAQSGGKDQAGSKDMVIFRNGRQVEGKIIEETATQVRMKVSVGGIEAETTYSKTEILQIVKGDGEPEKKDAAATQTRPAVASKPAPAAAEEGKLKVYAMELTGWFGEDISETPLRQAIRDAKKLDADYIIITLDNDWSLRRQGQLDELKDDDSAFEQFWRVEAMDPVITEEIEREWQKQPTIVFWVKKAMGGAAFLPLNCPNIYFSSDAKMGGIGRVERLIKSGDNVVKEKLIGARLGHVEGMAVKGGYDPRIVRAMARTEYVLSYSLEGGKPVFYENEDGDVLLTDDGDEQAGRKDTDEQLSRGEGDDCLTLTADLAYTLGVSKGTVDNLNDLLFQLGIARNSTILKNQAPQIMRTWRDGIDQAKRQLPKLWEDFGEVQVRQPGGYRERTQARGQRRKILEDMQAIMKKYEEAINPRQYVPVGWADIETIKKQIELEQLADRR